MAGEVGVSFVLGASVGASVASAFGSLRSKVAGAAGDLAKLQAQSKKLAKGASLKGQADQLGRELAQVHARRAELARSMAELRSKAAGGSIVAGADLKRLHAAYKALTPEVARLTAEYSKARAKSDEYAASLGKLAGREREVAAAQKRAAEALKIRERVQSHRDKAGAAMASLTGLMVPAMTLGAPLKLAVDFEAAMADVAKTVDGARDSEGRLTAKYHEMEEAVLDLGKTIPMSHKEIAAIMAAGGQLGISDAKELKEFTLMASQMSVAFGMSAEEAAASIGGFQSSLKLNAKDTRSVLDLMNQFANTSSAAEKDIADVVRRIGPLGSVAGVAAKPMTALAATLVSMKIAPEVAATGVKNLMLSLNAGTSATKRQRAAYSKLGIDVIKLSKQMQVDGPAAILAVLKRIKELPKYQQSSMLAELFGKESIGAIAPLLDQLDLVKKNLEISADPSQYEGAMAQEFANRNATTAAELAKLKNNLASVGVALGSVLLPMLNQAVAAITPWIEQLRAWIKANPELAGGLAKAGAAVFAAVAGFAVLKLAFHGLMGPLTLLLGPLKLLVGLLGQAGAAKGAASAIAALGTSAKAGAAGLAAKASTLGAGAAGALGTAATVAAPLAIGTAIGAAIAKPMTESIRKGREGEGMRAELEAMGLGADYDLMMAQSKKSREPQTPKPAAVTPAQSSSAQAKVASSLQMPPVPVPSPADFSRAQRDAGARAANAVPQTPKPAAVTPAQIRQEAQAPAQPAQKPAGQSGPSAPPVINNMANFTFTINGMPAADFANGVMNVVRSHQAELQSMISNIVGDQVRRMYAAAGS